MTETATRAAGDGPLAGLQVLEFTTAWAGPMAGRILAFLGADVIHVEHATRTDLWRQHGQAFRPRLYPDNEGGAHPWNRNALFNSQNLGKRSLSLDIKNPSSKPVIERLIARTDVLIANFAPGALARANLGYDRLSRLNPRIILVEMPAYGSDGPMSKAGAVGLTMEMASGMASLTGYAGDAPICTGPHVMDPIGGWNAAAAALTALLDRERTGIGQAVEVPQVEAAMQFIGAEMLHAAATGRDPPRQGNRVEWAAPHDVYPAAGHDQWLAVAVLDDEAWQGLRDVIGDRRLDDHCLRTLAGRLEARDSIDEIIGAWTRSRDKAEAGAELQAAGIAAAPVMRAGEALDSPLLAELGFFDTVTHREAGTHRYGGVPIRLSATPGSVRSAAPCLGEHTAEILLELGFDEAEIAALERDGTTDAQPV